jgi:hypothetical protein
VRRRQTISWLATLVLVGLATWGCQKLGQGMDWGWKADRPSGPLAVFSHQTHKNVFAREQIQCFACHTMTARIEDEKEAAVAIRASKDTFSGGKDACHACHYNPAGNIAPDRCGLCHVDVREIAPANHNFDWISRHLVFAKNDSENCQECHQERFCQDCHNRRDETVRSYHDTNIRFTHGIEARANPMKCGECHTQGFCQRCHTEGGYEH